jgi:hypothetical protein
MPRHFVATYEYTEVVHGKSREFVHESIIEAADQAAAYRAAIRHFDDLARESSVGWMRVLNRCAVAPSPGSASAKGGKTVRAPSELEK